MRLDVCDVDGCAGLVSEIMAWPLQVEKDPLRLCAHHALYYKSIAGPHMTFTKWWKEATA